MTAPALRDENTLAPFAAAALGIAVLTAMDVGLKLLAGRFETFEVVFLRFGSGALIMAIIFVALRTRLPTGEQIRANALRGLTIVATSASYVYGLSVMPLAECLALAHTAPFFMALFAWPILGERPPSRVLIAIAVGFVGALVIVFGRDGMGGAALPIEGVLAVSFSAASYGFAMVLLRQRTATDPVATIVLLMNLVPALLVLPFGAGVLPSLDGGLILGVLAIGVAGVAGHALLAHGFARVAAARVGIVEYTSFWWGALLGWAVFGDKPPLATYAGAALILAGCLIALTGPRTRESA